MESEKYRSSSECSSDANDDQINGGGRAKTSKRGYYGCTFCNRGFTNAQALGGHMNIHSKYRAKPKQKTNEEEEEEEDYLYPTYYSPSVISQSLSPNKDYPMNYNDMCFQLPPPPPAAAESSVSRSPCGGGGFNRQDQHNFGVARGLVLTRRNQEQRLGTNLSLRVGSNNKVDGGLKDDELDLELRLGNGR